VPTLPNGVVLHPFVPEGTNVYVAKQTKKLMDQYPHGIRIEEDCNSTTAYEIANAAGYRIETPLRTAA
jgi:hypothetical protein